MADSILFVRRRWRKELAIMVLVVIFAGITCAGCIHQKEGSGTAVAYEDYFRGDFVVTGEPILNQEVEIVFSVNPPVDSLNTEIEIFLPEGIELVQGNAYWEGDIQRDEVVEITIRVKSVQEGEHEIYVYVEGMLGGENEKDRVYYLVFLTAKDSGQVSRTHFYPPSPEGRTVEIPVGLALKSTPRPNVDEEIVLTFVVIASRDVSGVKAVIELPEEFILINGTLEWAGDLEAEQEETFQITIKTTERGRFKILGILTYDDEEWKYAIYIFVH